MQTYANRFALAMQPDRSEIVIKCYQEIPNVDLEIQDGIHSLSSAPTVEEVASLVMTVSCAKNLQKALSGLLFELEKEAADGAL